MIYQAVDEKDWSLSLEGGFNTGGTEATKII